MREIKERLNAQVLRVCEYLLPGGKVKSGEYQTGNLRGDDGQSLRVHLSGNKTGVWSDFATGEKGDIIDLWCMVEGKTLRDALKDIKQYLGIADHWTPPRKNYAKPNPVTPAPSQYLSGRGISQAVQSKYRISESDGVVHFPYYEDENLVFVKHRSTTAKKIWSDKGCKPICFGWQAIDPNARKIFITEGEIDAMSLAMYGLPAVSVPAGAGGGGEWVDNDWERLSCMELIYICFDNDQPGREGAEKLAERLGIERCKIVTLPENDANDCLRKKISIKEAVAGSRYLTLDTLTHVSEISPEPENTSGFAPEWGKAYIRFRHGELTVWTGINGHGKTTVLNHLMLMAMNQGERCAIASLETRPGKLLSRLKWTSQAGDSFLDSPLWLFTPGRKNRREELIKAIRYGRRRYGITQFVIDSLMKCGFAEDDYSGQKLFVEELCDMAIDLNMHIHLVAHARKKENEKQKLDKMDVKGSGAITDLAFNVISVWRNKKKERSIERGSSEKINDPDALLRIHKQREGDWEGGVKLWFDNKTRQFWDSNEYSIRVYKPERSSHETVRDMDNGG